MEERKEWSQGMEPSCPPQQPEPSAWGNGEGLALGSWDKGAAFKGAQPEMGGLHLA